MGSPSLETLRRQLREKFPQAHGWRGPAGPAAAAGDSAGGVAGRDGFAAGTLCEVVAGGPVSGLGLWLAGLLEETRADAAHPEWVLIDGTDAFDPASYPAAACARVLWVRCRSAAEVLKAADLLVRDGNVPWLLVDTTGMAGPARMFPAAGWWRLRQLVEVHGSRLVVLAERSLVPCAHHRWRLTAELSLKDWDCPRVELRRRLRMTRAVLTEAGVR